MGNPDHLNMLEQGLQGWNKWRWENPDIMPDLSEADMRAMDLVGADLSGANLMKADLRKANLWAANLIEANLFAADLTGADLTEANLSGANLTQANMTEVVFADTEGHSAALEHAILVGARFTCRGEGAASPGFLDLATADGLETADFGDPDFLPNYLAEAFEYAHHPKLLERTWWPDFFDKAVSRIKLLRKLYPDAQPPPALVEAIRTISAELIKQLKKRPDALYNIRPRQFEELIAEILASYGWDVGLTPETKDGGYDIFAISKDEKADVQTSWIIECKKYAPKKKVGVEIVRGLYCIKGEIRASNALLATTSHFTKGVKDFKASRYDLELKDFEGVIDWINTYRPNPNGKLYIKDNKLIVPGQD